MVVKKANKLRKKKQQNDRRIWLAIAAVIIIVLAVVAFLAHRSSNVHPAAAHQSTASQQPTTAKGSGNAVTGSSSTSDKGSSSSSGSTNTTTGITTAPSVKPAAPFGSFISNPTPGQSGAPLEEASVCNTSPNVDCDITFTKDGITKDLGAKPTDDSGAAYWNSWTPQNVGLTTGNWTVTAIATSGNQSTSTTSHTQLQVQ